MVSRQGRQARQGLKASRLFEAVDQALNVSLQQFVTEVD